MSRPNVSPEFATAFQQSHVSFFPLVKLDFDSGSVFVCGADFEVIHEGNTYLPMLGLGSISAISESASSINGLSFTLSGVQSESIAFALTEKYQGRRVTVKFACVDNEQLIVDNSVWIGLLDMPTINREGDTCTITVTAENRMIDWQRPRGLLFNNQDQLRINPTDTFFQGIENLIEREIVLFPATGSGSTSIDNANAQASGVRLADEIAKRTQQAITGSELLQVNYAANLTGMEYDPVDYGPFPP